MPFRSRGFRRRSGRPLRPTTWCGGFQDPFTVDPDNANPTMVNICDWTSMRLETGANPTIMRVRGWMSLGFTMEDATATPQSCRFAVGVAVVNMRNVVTGPNPSTDLDYDWLWLWESAVGTGALLYDDGGTVRTFQSGGGFSPAPIAIDTRAKRKLHPYDEVKLMLKGSNNAHVANVAVSFQLRVLLKQ